LLPLSERICASDKRAEISPLRRFARVVSESGGKPPHSKAALRAANLGA
jgi:hypothetical protein